MRRAEGAISRTLECPEAAARRRCGGGGCEHATRTRGLQLKGCVCKEESGVACSSCCEEWRDAPAADSKPVETAGSSAPQGTPRAQLSKALDPFGRCLGPRRTLGIGRTRLERREI